MSSYVTGILGLLVLLLVSVTLTACRPRLDSRVRTSSRFSTVVVASILAQGTHFLEELRTGFFVRFPETLGIPVWSESFFVWFNVAWLGLWAAGLVGVRAGWVVALCPLWFLGLAMLLNLVAHPVLAIRVGGYFPGLVTSPLVGVLGALLLLELLKVSNSRAAA